MAYDHVLERFELLKHARGQLQGGPIRAAFELATPALDDALTWAPAEARELVELVNVGVRSQQASMIREAYERCLQLKQARPVAQSKPDAPPAEG